MKKGGLDELEIIRANRIINSYCRACDVADEVRNEMHHLQPMRKAVRAQPQEIAGQLRAGATVFLASLLIAAAPLVAADEAPEFEVTAIITGEEPTAVVNNMMVVKGDIVDGAEVIEITDHYVRLRYDDEIITSVLLGDYSAPEDELYELMTSDEVKKAIYKDD